MATPNPTQTALNKAKAHLNAAWRDLVAVGSPDSYQVADLVAATYKQVAHLMAKED